MIVAFESHSPIAHWRVGDDLLTLSCTWRNEATSARLTVRLDNGSNRDGMAIETTLSGKFWEVAYVLPIRVKGQSAPQVLLRLRRPNWMDYGIYRVDENGIRRDFGISVRDPQAIRWETHRGSLVGFTLYDRWRPPPAWMRDHEPRGKRWEWVTHWTFTSEKAWHPGKGRWHVYRFDTPPGGQDFSAIECPFAFQGGAKTTPDFSRASV